MTEEVDDKASGDVVSEASEHKSVIPEPEPVKVPDVELTVDGFGFMPKQVSIDQTKKNGRKKSKELKEIMTPDAVTSPCASSSNIDVVRRFTWKTKNRMTVQV